MPDVTVKLEGFQELDKSLRELSDNLAKNALRAGVRAGANVMLAEIRNRVPVGRGNIISTKKGDVRRHIKEDLRVNTKFTGLTASATIAPRKFAYIVNWLERTGAKPHKEPKLPRAKAMLIPGHGFVRQVMHPGFRPRPFILPAFNASWERALEAFKQKLSDAIDRYKAKS